MCPGARALVALGADPARWSPYMLSVLRMVAAFLFMAHGTQKLFGFPASQPLPGVDLGSLMGVADSLELIGGSLLLLGLFARPTAFVLAGEMAFAYFTQHMPHGVWPILNSGELAVIYCFLFLFICTAGPGVLSLDALLRRSRIGHRTYHHGRWAHQH